MVNTKLPTYNIKLKSPIKKTVDLMSEGIKKIIAIDKKIKELKQDDADRAISKYESALLKVGKAKDPISKEKHANNLTKIAEEIYKNKAIYKAISIRKPSYAKLISKRARDLGRDQDLER